MKDLLIHVITDEKTDLEIFKQVISEKKGINVIYEKNIEKTIDAINANLFDLLIIDLDLPKNDYQKIQRLINLIYPDAAVTEMEFTDKIFINYKIDQLLDKWRIANSEDDSPKFWDNLF